MRNRSFRSKTALSRRFVFDTLEAIIRLGGSGTVGSISDVSGYSEHYFSVYSMRLQRMGLIEKPFGRSGYVAAIYTITESAKIALAIEMGRQTKARATRLLNSRATAAPPPPSPPTPLSPAEHAEAWLSRHAPRGLDEECSPGYS